MSTPQKRALGKGLGALLGDSEGELSPQFAKSGEPRSIVGTVIDIKLEYIETNPFQPRSEFKEEQLQELCDSIKQLGIIQPVTVRNVDKNKFQLISGERRFRASKMAGLDKIPAYIRVANDQAMLEMALVENIQRQDLDAIEIAISYNRLIEECNITQEEMSERVGKKRSTISNYLRLLKLPPEVQMGIREDKISMGHARAIVNIEHLETQLSLFYDIVENELSVRQVESIVKDLKENGDVVKNKTKTPPSGKQSNVIPAHIASYRDQLSNYFGSNVDLKRTIKGQGAITIPFKNDEDFERLLKLLNF